VKGSPGGGAVQIAPCASADPARFRLAGTRIGTLFDRELTGAPFMTLFEPDDRLLAGRLLAAVTGEHTIAILDLVGQARGDRSVTLELVMLPLCDADPRVLGALNPLSVPYWLGADPIAPLRMAGVRLLDPDRELFSLANRPAIALPERRSRPTRAGAALRVIEGTRNVPPGFRTGSPVPSPDLRIVHGGRANGADPA